MRTPEPTGAGVLAFGASTAMSLTETEIEEVARELQPIVGAFVEKIYLPEPRTVVFELRKPGKSFLLLLCAETSRTRLHLVMERPLSPDRPFGFQGLLRAHSTGACLDRIEAKPGERLVSALFLCSSLTTGLS